MSPDNETDHTGDVTLNITDVSEGPVSFQVKTPDSDEYGYFGDGDSEEVSANENGFWTINYTKGDSASSGEFDFRANETDGDWVTLENVTLDAREPSVSSESPEGYTTEESPTVSYDVSDSHSGVNEDTEYIEVVDSDGDTVEDSSSTSVDVSSLSDEEYTVNYEVADNVGNWNNDSWTFTVDTSYDGDTSPSLDWDSYLSGSIILMNSDETLTIGYNDDEERPNEVTCYDSGDRIDSDSTSSSGDNEYQFDCRFDDSDYSGSEVDLTIEACDEAGNCHEYDAGNFVFDSSSPTFIEDPSAVVGIYNDDFAVDFMAFDDASGLDQVEYFFDVNTDKGDGYIVDINNNAEEFTVNSSNIEEEGQNTLHVRLRDEAGRWSDMKSFNFEYDPEADPEISLDVPDDLTVTAGESKSFDITVENTGNLLVSGAGLTVEGAGLDITEVIDDLYPGDSVDISFEVSPDEEHIGTPEITASAENPAVSESFDLRVEANEDQRSEIESDLSEYQSKLETLRDNVSSLKEEGLSEDLSSQLDSDFSSFEQEVEDAQAAVDDGRYYEAQSIFDDIDSTHDTASSTFSEVEQTYQENQRQKMIMFAVIGFFGIIALGGGLFWRSEEFDFDYERIIDSDIGVASFDGLDLEGLKSRVSTIFENKEEAEEFEWQGFK